MPRQVARLARLAAGRPEPDASANGNGAPAECLLFDDFRTAAPAAYSAVDVPDNVVDILVELRNWLQVGGGGPRLHVLWRLVLGAPVMIKYSHPMPYRPLCFNHSAPQYNTQDKCEPPIYVSDRRFMKSVQLLQVVAHADGRAEANEYDALLLEHVFGNRPDDSVKVRGGECVGVHTICCLSLWDFAWTCRGSGARSGQLASMCPCAFT